MRKRIVVSFVFVAVVSMGIVAAQTAVDGVVISGVRLALAGDLVEVSFRADVDRKAVRSDYTLTLTPVLTDAVNRSSLEPVVVRGKRAVIRAQREARSLGIARIAATEFAADGQAIVYSATVPYLPWMEGATLSLERVCSGCCTETVGTPVLLAQALVLRPPAVIDRRDPEPLLEPQLSTAERLALTRAFLAPVAESEDALRFVEQHREGSLSVYFRQGAGVIDHAFKNNSATLNELLVTVREIENSRDSRVVRTTIAGYASPEGSAVLNNRLANERAVMIKGYLVENTPLTSSMVEIRNGGIDWYGLRQLVAASSMPEKQQILDIIDNTSIGDAQRHSELIRLKGGEPYRYMLNEFFAELRNATYIRVYFENNAKE